MWYDHSVQPDWFDNDGLFRSELEEGHRQARKVSLRLEAQGLTTSLTPLAWRSTIDDRHQFSGEIDLKVERLPVEAKSRRLTFTDKPHTYPFATAFIDTVSGWEQKTVKPRAVVLVSQETGCMLVVPVSGSRSQWSIKATRDRVRDIHDEWYVCSRGLLVTFDYFVSWLKKQ